MASPDLRDEALQQSLARLERALRPGPGAKASTLGRPAGGRVMAVGAGLVAAAAGVGGAAAATGHPWLMAPAAVLVGLATALMFPALRRTGPRREQPARRPHVGMGASIEAGVVVEPGAVVEMGASVGAGSLICSGAVIKMGASIERDVRIGQGAVVSWGASVKSRATVGAGAVVGTGSSVGEGAVVPDGMKVAVGSTWGAGTGATASDPRGARTAAPAADPREGRIASAFNRLESELAASPEGVRDFLGSWARSIPAFRTTFRALLDREAALRRESAAEQLKALADERAAVEKRIADQPDADIRRSLSGALDAIDDMRRQREGMGKSADRLEAEVTRLTLTLEAVGTQLVRLRSAGGDAAQARTEVSGSLKQLHDEVDAIAGALEETTSSGVIPVADISSEPAAPQADSRDRLRT
jgi:carbonic anhydrase/acetyltransferase-like protein (isoleucine patch superfamily)